MKYRNLFFDLDDTLWATFQNNTECLEELYNAHNFGRYYASFEAFLDIYWPHNNHLWDEYRKGTINRKTLIIERFSYMSIVWHSRNIFSYILSQLSDSFISIKVNQFTLSFD